MKGERRYSLPAARSCRRAWDDQSLSHRGGRVGGGWRSLNGAQCTASSKVSEEVEGGGGELTCSVVNGRVEF